MASSMRSAIRAKHIFILAGLFVVIVGMIVWRALRSGGPPASVTFLGYTNDASGTRLASFAVTNLRSFVVRRQAGYWIEVRAPVGQTNFLSRWFSSGQDLDPRASEVITVPVPTNQAPWRVLLPIRTDLSWVSEVVEGVRLISPYKLPETKSYELRGSWIED
jgi:hypothetical protein